MTRNIGGSILPSSDARIRRPLTFGKSTLQVVAHEGFDTHFLTLDGRPIAEHPNGYSCHELAVRMISGNADRVKEQHDYIEACGGMCRPWRAFAYWMEG